MEKASYKGNKPAWLNTVDTIFSKVAVIGFYALLVGIVAAFVFYKLKLSNYLLIAEGIAIVGATLHIVINTAHSAMTSAYEDAIEDALKKELRKKEPKKPSQTRAQATEPEAEPLPLFEKSGAEK